MVYMISRAKERKGDSNISVLEHIPVKYILPHLNATLLCSLEPLCNMETPVNIHLCAPVILSIEPTLC